MNLKKMPLVLAVFALLLTLVVTGCKSEPDDPEKYTVTFDALGGTIDNSTDPVEITVESGKTIAELPAPVKSTAPSTFWGWFTSDGSGGSGWGNGFNETSKVTKNITVYARWEASAKPDEYTVTFNANGGSVTPTTLTVFEGATCTPPKPTKISYTFMGWYTEQNDGGTSFTDETPVVASITVYAQWRSATDPYLGETLSLQGPVDQEQRSNTTGSITYTKYNGSLEFDGWEIVNGNLNAEYPGEDEYLQTIDSWQGYEDLMGMYDDLDISDPTAKIASRDGLWDSDEVNNYVLRRGNSTLSVNTGSRTITGTDEEVEYFYVDKDLTISGTGKTSTNVSDEESPPTTVNETTKNFTLNLKKGWNAIYTKTDASGSFTGTIQALTSVTMNETVTMELKNPANLKWALYIIPIEE